MIRFATLVTAVGLLASCEQHRDPKANCFKFLSRGPAAVDCTFEPLAGPDIPDKRHE